MVIRRRSWRVYLHWLAAGDELPRRTPDFILNRWPDRLLQKLACRITGHTLDEPGFLACIWCQHIEEPDE
jgi:hypothetical protein